MIQEFAEWRRKLTMDKLVLNIEELANALWIGERAARHFAISMCRVMRQQKTEARIRRKGVLIYLERA